MINAGLNIVSTKLPLKAQFKPSTQAHDPSIELPTESVTLSGAKSEGPSAIDGIMSRALIGGLIGGVALYPALSSTGPAGLGFLVGAGLGTGAAMPAAVTDYIGSERGWSPATRGAASVGATAVAAGAVYLWG